MVATLRELIYDCDGQATYAARYYHRVPESFVVNRSEYLLRKCRAQRVLSLGGSGPVDEAIANVAEMYVSVDRVNGPGRIVLDLDVSPEKLARIATEATLILCAEVLEHLSNPGRLLDMLYRRGKPMIVTAPNAFSELARNHMTRAVENVNPEHVAWYSYHTLKTLLERHKFRITQFHWYNGKPFFAEGLIFEVDNG